MTNDHHSAIKNAVVKPRHANAGEIKIGTANFRPSVRTIIWLRRWNVVDNSNTLVDSRIEFKRRRPHRGDWEEEEGEHLRRTTATIHALVRNLPPEEFQKMPSMKAWEMD